MDIVVVVAAVGLTISKLLIYPDIFFHTTRKKRKYPRSSSCVEKRASLISGVRGQKRETGWRP